MKETRRETKGAGEAGEGKMGGRSQEGSNTAAFCVVSESVPRAGHCAGQP